MKILQIAPALHGAQMQTTEGSYPVVVWAVLENDDGSDDVIGLAVGGKGDRALIPPDPGTFESYSQSGCYPANGIVHRPRPGEHQPAKPSQGLRRADAARP